MPIDMSFRELFHIYERYEKTPELRSRVLIQENGMESIRICEDMEAVGAAYIGLVTLTLYLAQNMMKFKELFHIYERHVKTPVLDRRALRQENKMEYIRN